MITQIFLDHPRKVEESYLQHAAFAGKTSFRLFGAAMAALIHALIPCLFERTASRMILDIAEPLSKRG